MARLADKQLGDLLRRCTGWPWQLVWDETHDRWSLLASSEALRSKVAYELPKDIDVYDRRLMALAPELAAEVLQLRKKLGV